MTQSPGDDTSQPEGVRQRKRRETRRRIAEAGLKLFLADGYEATTLDAIARAAGISRRTFFAYFESKDDILLAWQGGAWDAICAEVAASAPGRTPIDLLIGVFLRYAELQQSGEMLRIDRLLRSSPTLQARKQAHYAAQERALFDALSAVWPQPERREALRLVAMAAVGALRIAVEAWSRDDGREPVAAYVGRAFAALRAEV